MAFTVPNAVNYSSPLNAVPLDWTSPPVEGAKGIQCTINWGTQGGANDAVYVNCQNNATLNFSKIRAIIVDNSKSGADIEFIFPDTETTVTVPSYTPYAIIPVFTNQTQFYVVAEGAASEDISSFTILNTAPPPLAVPTTQEQNFFSSSPINANASGSLALLPSTANGTIEALSIGGALSSGTVNSAALNVSLHDGSGNIFMQAILDVPASSISSQLLFQLSDLRLRFQDGLTLSWVTTGAPVFGLLVPNVYYRTP